MISYTVSSQNSKVLKGAGKDFGARTKSPAGFVRDLERVEVEAAIQGDGEVLLDSQMNVAQAGFPPLQVLSSSSPSVCAVNH